MLSIFLSACSSGGQENINQENLKIMTTIYPNQFLIENVTNHKIENLSQNKSIHEYKPSAKDLSRLFDQDLVIIQSRNLETYVWDLKDELETKGVKILELSNEGNYHTWLSPLLTLSNLEKIKNEIINLDEDYDFVNYENFISKIENLHAKYTNELSNCKNDSVLVSHDFLTPTGQSYGFEVNSLVNEDHFVGFSTKSFVDTLNSKYKYILSEPNLINDLSETLKSNNEEHDENIHDHVDVSEILGEKLDDFEVLEIHPIESSKVDYLKALELNLNKLKTALECQK